LQNNLLQGNLPITLADISSLLIVDVSNNFLSGVVPFLPSFELIGIETNQDLSSPAQSESAISKPSTEIKLLSDNDELDVSLIAGASIVFILVLGVAATITTLFKRRKDGKETNIELQLIPKYSSPNKKVRLMSKLNSGGFGVVWKARYKGETVAIKLIRMDKHKGKEEDEADIKILKMVVEEASIMEKMVHERIVKFIMFEIESFGIVLEYLPLGSLSDQISRSKGYLPWTFRHQMMIDICEGMEFLHSGMNEDGSSKQVLFHQDLKSANVLMCMEGIPATLRGKICDFGLSCKNPLNSCIFSFEGHCC
jgi:hypothetical protein